MKLFQYLLLLIFSLGLLGSSCNEDDATVGKTTEVTINFLATYGDEPFILTLQEYDYPSGNKIRFKDEFGFYISDLVMLEQQGTDQTELSEIEYVDFNANASVQTAEIPYSLTFNVPVGEYKGLRFDLGVPADLNAMQPGDFGMDDPLAATSRYWQSWSSYTFLRLAGCYDRNGDGLETSCNIADEDDTSVVFHTGGNMAYRSNVSFLKNITLEENQPYTFDLIVDVREILAPEGDVIELGTTDQLHTNDINDPNDIDLINRSMDNLATRAITLQ